MRVLLLPPHQTWGKWGQGGPPMSQPSSSPIGQSPPSWSPGVSPPSLMLALMLPQHPPPTHPSHPHAFFKIFLFFISSPTSPHAFLSLPVPLGALGGQRTPASLSSAALSLPVFIWKPPTPTASRTRGCAGLWGSGIQGPERAVACLGLHSKAKAVSLSSEFPLVPPAPSPCFRPPILYHKTSEPIKGAEKIMNKPGKHEINIRRKTMAAIK